MTMRRPRAGRDAAAADPARRPREPARPARRARPARPTLPHPRRRRARRRRASTSTSTAARSWASSASRAAARASPASRSCGCRAPGRVERRRDHLRRPGPADPPRRRDARASAATGSAMIFQQPTSVAEPGHARRHQIGEVLELHRNMKRKAGPRPGARAAAHGRHPRPGAAARRVPAPALRRHGAARDDRHGARLRAGAAHRRRADDRARRHHPGPDPRPDARPPATRPARRSSSSPTTSAWSPRCATGWR